MFFEKNSDIMLCFNTMIYTDLPLFSIDFAINEANQENSVYRYFDINKKEISSHTIVKDYNYPAIYAIRKNSTEESKLYKHGFDFVSVPNPNYDFEDLNYRSVKYKKASNKIKILYFFFLIYFLKNYLIIFLYSIYYMCII